MSNAATISTPSTGASPLLSGSDPQASEEPPSLLILVREADSTAASTGSGLGKVVRNVASFLTGENNLNVNTEQPSSSTFKTVLLRPGDPLDTDFYHPFHILGHTVCVRTRGYQPSGWTKAFSGPSTMKDTVGAVLKEIHSKTDAYDDKGKIYVVNERELHPNFTIKTSSGQLDLHAGHNGTCHMVPEVYVAFRQHHQESEWVKGREWGMLSSLLGCE